MAAKKILITDDDPDILMVLEQRLTGCGYEVFKAKDGEEACAKAKTVKPDLIIMDVLMPRMTGYDALRKIREESCLCKVPAIIFSARGSMRDFFSGFPNVEFINKPYDAQVLLTKARRLMGDKEPITPATSEAGPSPAGKAVPAPEARRSVVVLGVQDGLTEKIISMISSMGIEAERALNEEDACKTAQKMRAEKIFCQYWEDDKVLDAKKVSDRFLKTPGLADVSFFVYCEARNSLEAMKVFREDKIIGYSQAGDLLPKIKNVLGAPA